MGWSVIEGDCLDVLPGLEPSSFDVAVADPPYIIGGTSVGNPESKSGTWADMVNAAAWYREWFTACARLLAPTGYLLVFGNWRSLPTYLCAASRCDALFPSSCMVWDKQWIGPGPKRALRPRWELVLWLAMPEAEVGDRSAADVEACKWMAGNSGKSGHPAEKPVALIRRILSVAAPRGRSVLDPFCGRASSGLAALDLGMDWVGVEADGAHCAAARLAIGGHMRQLDISIGPGAAVVVGA